MDCVFCKIAKKEIPADIFYESENFIAIKDIHPKTQGHSLIIPKNHYEKFTDLPSSLYNEFLETAKKVIQIVLEETSSASFNMVMNNGKQAGQIVPHLHLHILPRKEGDGFKVSV